MLLAATCAAIHSSFIVPGLGGGAALIFIASQILRRADTHTILRSTAAWAHRSRIKVPTLHVTLANLEIVRMAATAGAFGRICRLQVGDARPAAERGARPASAPAHVAVILAFLLVPVPTLSTSAIIVVLVIRR